MANSRRPSGRCVAGKVLSNKKIGPWIRPISKRLSHEIADRDRVYKDDVTYAELLDIVTVTFLCPSPVEYQTENEIIDGSVYWAKKGQATWKQIVEATDEDVNTLWINGESTYHGTNDKIPELGARTLRSSLLLIEPEQFSLHVGFESAYQGHSMRRVRAVFNFNGTHYNFIVTDPYIEELYFKERDGAYGIPEARLSISLAEIKYKVAMKLVAAVITPDRCAQ